MEEEAARVGARLCPAGTPLGQTGLPGALSLAPPGLPRSLNTINGMWPVRVADHFPANVSEPSGELWTVAENAVSMLGCDSPAPRCTYHPGMGCWGQRGTPAVVEGKACGGTLYFPLTSAVNFKLLFLKKFS